jgi:hypothetical protein
LLVNTTDDLPRQARDETRLKTQQHWRGVSQVLQGLRQRKAAASNGAGGGGGGAQAKEEEAKEEEEEEEAEGREMVQLLLSKSEMVDEYFAIGLEGAAGAGGASGTEDSEQEEVRTQFLVHFRNLFRK